VHGSYNNDANCGFDIAVCKLGESFGGSNFNTTYFSNAPLVFDDFQGNFPLD